jgi:NADH:ubiquinone oxidoreductase subunit C
METFLQFHSKSFLTALRCVEYTALYPVLHFKQGLSSRFINFILKYLKKSTLTRYNNLTELTVIDNPANVNRFELFFLLTSIEFNTRLALQFPITNAVTPSLSSVYPNSS